jgi:hypothetical protein
VPAWSAWVPLYSTVTLLRLVGRPGWWLVLYFVPIVNIVVAVLTLNDLAKSFGRTSAFTVGLVLLAPIFQFVLWLDGSRYLGPHALRRTTHA